VPARRAAGAVVMLASVEADVRLAELVAALSLAIDIGTGQPLEQGLGVGVLAVGLGEEAGLREDELARTWYVALLRHVGCTADSHVFGALVGDEIAFRAGATRVDVTSPAALVPYLIGHLVRTTGPLGAAARLGRMAAAPRLMQQGAVAVCEVAERLADRIGLAPEVGSDLALGSERWDGRGFLRRAAGEAVPRPVRVVQIAETARAVAAFDGAEAAVAMLRERAGHALDPSLVERFCARAPALLRRLEAPSLWDAALDCEPGPRPRLAGDRLDAALHAMAEFVDLKSPCTVGHSAGVAGLAAAAAERAGLPAAECASLRRAALVHDVGRVGVPSRVWEKPGALTADERERVRLHPYYTERVLAPACAPLAALGALASLHHERLDGSGYHRGAGARALGPAARILAAADALHAMTEPRPHRAALCLEAAVDTLRAEVRGGRVDGDAAEAVIAAAGGTPARRRHRVGGLTEREVEVLRLLARGHSKREIAAVLTIAPKTADAHVQHIYAKIGVSTRAAATVFAMRHDLVGAAGR
jgi:HD-GYP domain-containing protein (c-di-GMP phosphodiesterase class II)